MSHNKLEKLTPEQEALLTIILKQWIGTGLDTSPTDKPKAEEAITFAYECAELKPPNTFMWFSNPVEAGIWVLSNQYNYNLSSTKYKIEQAFERVVANIVDKDIWNYIWNSLYTPAVENIWEVIFSTILGDICKAGVQSSFSSVWQVLNRVTHVKDSKYHATNWLACCAYFDAIGIACSKIKHLSAYAKHCGWWWAFQDVVVITLKPKAIRLDNNGRLHGEGEPALAYEGWNVYANHGVRLPEKYGQLHPRQWQAQWLLEEDDAELRLLLFQVIGYARICQELPDKATIQNEEWLLETLRYYRQLHFFEQYQQLSDNELIVEILDKTRKTGNWYDLQMRRDEAVLLLDTQRVITIAFDSSYDNIYLVNLNTALREFQHLAQISRGVFSPQNITAYYINYENEKISTWSELNKYLTGLTWMEQLNPFHKHKAILEFELDRAKHSVVVGVEPSIVAGQINHLLKDTGHEFVLCRISPEGLLMFLSQEEKQKIQSERGLELYTVEPRVFEKTFTPSIQLEHSVEDTHENRLKVIDKTSNEISRLGWDRKKGPDYLLRTYGKRSRHELTDEELAKFLRYLESQPTPEA